MIAGQVLEILGCTRQTLHCYVKGGKIRVEKIRKRYDYNEEDVLLLARRKHPGKVIVYTRTFNFNKDLNKLMKIHQDEIIKDYLYSHKIIDYDEIHDDESINKKPENLIAIVKDIVNRQVNTLITYHPSCLAMDGSISMDYMFISHGCKLIFIGQDDEAYDIHKLVMEE